MDFDALLKFITPDPAQNQITDLTLLNVGVAARPMSSYVPSLGVKSFTYGQRHDHRLDTSLITHCRLQQKYS